MTFSKAPAVVTGAGRGIGRSLALSLARIGHPVVIQARTPAQLEAVKAEIESAGGRCQISTGDVTEGAAAEALLNVCEEHFGPAQVVVACAGQAHAAPLLKTDADRLRSLLEVNVVSAFHLMKASAERLKKQKLKGRIVVVASTAAIKGFPYTSAYSASKHAVLGLVRSAAMEWAPYGITVNALCPGWVDTPMFTDTIENISKKTGCSLEEARQKIEAMVPIGEVLTSEEVAGYLEYIVSDAAAKLTGQALVIDGGETIK